MSQPSALNKSKSTCETLRTSIIEFINKITEQLMGDTVDNDEIEDLKFQLIEKAEQLFKLDSEVQKLTDNLENLIRCSKQSEILRKIYEG